MADSDDLAGCIGGLLVVVLVVSAVVLAVMAVSGAPVPRRRVRQGPGHSPEHGWSLGRRLWNRRLPGSLGRPHHHLETRGVLEPLLWILGEADPVFATQRKKAA